VLSLLSPQLASVVARVAGIPCGWIAGVAHRSAAFPHSSVAWPRGAVGVLLAAAAVLAAVAVARRRSLWRAAIVALVGVVLTGWLVVPRTLPRWPPPGWQVVACDIGQGDALLLRGTEHVAPVLVDAGPDPRPLRRCLDQLDVRSLSAVVLSHLHADHVEGLPAVLGHVPTPVVLVNPLDEPALEGRRVRGWAARARTPVSVLDAGQSFTAAGIGFDVLGPAPVLHGTDSDPNNDSLVLLARLPGLRMLLTGDVQPEAQENLLARGVPQVDVLKVPHHGSAHQEDRFLRATGARLSLTSVGAGNPYGHPSAQTERTLAEDGTTDLRTDLDGSVAITSREDRPIAVPQRRSRPGQPVALPAVGRPRPLAVASSTATVAAHARGLVEPTRAPTAAPAGPRRALPEPRARSPCPQSGVPRPSPAVRHDILDLDGCAAHPDHRR
jgi:competence protein ComEC